MSHNTAGPERTFHFPLGVKEVLSGTVAGLVGTVFGFPLDTIKVRLQTQSHLYRGSFDCFWKVLKTEGVLRGFYRGIAPPLISLTILNSLSFGTYAQFKRILANNILTGDSLSTTKWLFPIAGAGTGAVASLVSTPFEMVKVTMQLDNVHGKRFRGSVHCATSLVSTFRGPRILYKGFLVNTTREMVFGSVYFGFYELLKLYLTGLLSGKHQSQSSAPLAIMIAGGLSGASAWFASFPLDVIKANIQGNLTARVSFLSAVKQRWQQHGVAGFYAGIGPSIMRAFIVSSSRFMAYEYTLRILTVLESGAHYR